MAKKGKSREQKSPAPESKEKTKKKTSKKDEEDSKRDEIKKPQRGLAIGENFGWTGKLPATLLHEHCQKQKWRKVIFEMKKNAKGFTGIVILSWENPKTKEVIEVKMIPEHDLYEPQETTNAARHYAATYALYRINYLKNMKMLLPIIFRDYWSSLEAKRQLILKSDKNLHDSIYNADPFSVVLRQREINEKREKERLLREQNDAKVKKPSINILTSTKTGKNANDLKSMTKTAATKKPIELVPSFPKKVWSNSPFIDFDPEIRTSIENSIKNHIDWILEDHSKDIDQVKKNEYVEQLTKFGFRSTHVEEALSYTSNFTEALEWLLFHIPEDDLPPLFARREEDSAVSFKISKNIQQEYMLLRLGESAFDQYDILSSLEKNNNDEIETAIDLTRKLINFPAQQSGTSDSDLWEQEIEGIEMIGSNVCKFVENTNKRVVTIKLNPTNIASDLLSLRLYRSKHYPFDIPGLQLVVTNSSFKLANYLKLSILRQLLETIISQNYLGDCFIFPIIEWLENNISRIIDNPGPLVTFKPDRNKSKASANQQSKSTRTRKTGRILLSENDIEKIKSSDNKRKLSSEMKDSLSKRKALPAWNKRENLVSVINDNKVTLVTGETGSGKSTQIVQFILDHLNESGDYESTILCTQPRRISTIGLAERISDERIDKVGNETGYIIRGENNTCKTTRISFVTTGVLLRMLQSALSSNEDMDLSLFDRLKYIFIDEVHERSVDSDFLLIILKRIMKKLPNLKIVLMSATIDITVFQRFFDTPVNHIHIEGRTFPIKDHYLDEVLASLEYTMTNRDGEETQPKADSQFFKSGTLNYDLIAKLCDFIHKKLSSEANNGSILIFLPGIMEINRCIKTIEREFNDNKTNVWCLPLHSALSSQDQKRVFKSPPRGTRKIVVATNVAETSITIPDCVVVIDSGRSKTLFFDSQINATKLLENWCSRAEIMQRRGRSGRIQNGDCYHLYTKETENGMIAQPIPEIMRTRLENLYLVVKSMGINNVEEFLKGGLNPPDSISLSNAKFLLTQIGALNKSEQLSHLGRYLSYLPTDLHSGKLLILGCIFGCLELCLVLASLSSSGSPFLNSHELRSEIKLKKSMFSKDRGDLLGSAKAYLEYEKLRLSEGNSKKFIKDNYLSYLTLNEITSVRSQYLSLLKDIGFVPLSYHSRNKSDALYISLNKNQDNFSIVSAIITGAFYPNIARVQLPDPKYFQSSVGSVEIDPDIKQTKFWIQNKEFVEQFTNNKMIEGVLPAKRAFIHPSSLLFSDGIVANDESVSLDEFKNEDGSINFEKARANYKPDLTPQVPKSSNSLKNSFVVFTSSSFTSKLYLRDITPSSTMATILFGGAITYDVSNNINNGIVIDNWMPIRTWCKNGVLIKRLGILLDQVIHNKLSSPHFNTLPSDSDADSEILSVVETILRLNNK